MTGVQTCALPISAGGVYNRGDDDRPLNPLFAEMRGVVRDGRGREKLESFQARKSGRDHGAGRRPQRVKYSSVVSQRSAEGARLCVVRAVGMRNLNLTRQLEWLSEPREQDYEGQLRSQHVPKRGVYRCCLTARA